MAAQVLVMCEACGRPQFANRPDCVGCGAKLPEAPAPKAAPSAREKLIAGYEPFLEADFGRGRLLLLSEKQIEWRVGASRPLVADLGKVAQVRYAKRPVWETGLPAVLVLLVALLPMSPWVRVSLVAFSMLWVVAGALQRRCALIVVMKDGARASIPLGVGRPAVLRADSVWATMGPELARLGVPVAP